MARKRDEKQVPARGGRVQGNATHVRHVCSRCASLLLKWDFTLLLLGKEYVALRARGAE